MLGKEEKLVSLVNLMMETVILPQEEMACLPEHIHVIGGYTPQVFKLETPVLQASFIFENVHDNQRILVSHHVHLPDETVWIQSQGNLGIVKNYYLEDFTKGLPSVNPQVEIILTCYFIDL